MATGSGISGRRGWAAVAVVGFLVMGSCGGDRHPLAAPPPLPISDQVFAVGFSRIADTYIDPPDLARLTVDGLSALRVLDAEFAVELDERTLKVSLGGDTLGALSAPAGNDPAGWATLATQAIERGRAQSRHLGEATPGEVYQVVFDAVMAGLDPYSRYIGPRRAGRERAQREGFGGIGLTVDAVEGGYAVQTLDNRGPAERAGVRVGDLVEAIDGLGISALSLQEVLDHLTGPVGSVVALTVRHGHDDGAVTLSLRREREIVNTVSTAIDGRIVRLRIERFNAATTSNLRDAIAWARSRLGRNRAQGYILDLRGNPGGLLDQAVAVADLFIRRGRIITTAGRHPDSWQRFEATGDDLIDGLPLAVLIDGRSASASEVVAAALQDNARAVIIGASSFGKGSVQTVTRLPNDGELFLTWARIYAPSGYTLHRQGVQPTICTSRDQSSPDQVLDPLRHGQTSLPAELAEWRRVAPEDEQALANLRETCPWKAHEPALDVQVALELIADRALFMSALTKTVVAER